MSASGADLFSDNNLQFINQLQFIFSKYVFNSVAVNDPKQYNHFLIWYLLYVTDHMTY